MKQGVVVAGAGAPGRPPAGSRGLPPHVPASWQGAWVSGRSSARRRSAWRPNRSSGTPRSPWPCPWASAARSSRSRRSDSRSWPLSPPKMRRSEALRPQGKLCPCTPDVKGGRTRISARQQRARPGSTARSGRPAREGCSHPPRVVSCWPSKRPTPRKWPLTSRLLIGSGSRPGQPSPRQPGARAPNGRLALVVLSSLALGSRASCGIAASHPSSTATISCRSGSPKPPARDARTRAEERDLAGE